VAPVVAWCDLPFKDIVHQVDLVVLAEYRKPRGKPAAVFPLQVFKGLPIAGPLALDPRELRGFRPRNGSLFLLALSKRHRLVQYLERLGACSPVNAVLLRGGKLRGEDRFNYDNGSEPMTLEEVKADLAAHLAGR
jgi:hypothetical protein